MSKFLPILAFGISTLTFAQNGDMASMQAWASDTQPVVDEAPAFELVSFVADPVNGEGISLRWNTHAEPPATLFTLERSSDRMNWRPVFTHDGEGGLDNFNAYEVMDLAPLSGLAYYRLVASADGLELETSDDFAVEYRAEQALRIENDPVPGRFSIHGNGQITEMRLLNNRGQFVPMELDFSGNAVHARTEGLQPGTYFVHATVDGNPVFRQVLVTSTGVVGG